uniref:Zinc knuckle family protein n=1 Tax=Solanum tuberosum TaxID=4113 RepID=Q60D42_SOLTU|nr:Zinc knuckle family protein [Solanum tuberosum]
MPPRRAVRVRPAMKSVEEQELPNALEVQTQEKIKYADFREAIQMLSQVATFHVGQRDNRHEVVDISRIRELLRMNPPSFTGLSISENPENFIEELKRMVADMMSRMSLYVAGLSRQSSKEDKAAMLIGDIDLARFMIHLQQVEEDKLKDREEFKDKRAKINKDGYNRNSYSFRVRLAYPQGSMVPRGSKAPACARCGRTHIGKCRDGQTGCFKCGQEGHFLKECPKNRQGSGNLSNRAQASSVAPPYMMVPRGATSSTGGGVNRLYAINSCQEQDDSPDVVTGMIRVFDFVVYVLLDPRASLSFVISYVAMNFDVIPVQPSEPVIEWSSSSSSVRPKFGPPTPTKKV